MATVSDWLKIIHIQILAVLVLLAVYAGNACACSTRSEVARDAVKSELRNLASAQAAFREAEGRYALTASELRFAPNFDVSLAIDGATATGWSARGVHPDTRWTCAIHVGDAPPPREGATDGEVICWEW